MKPYHYLLLLLTLPLSTQAQWNLIWSDEFETEGTPDPKNWTYEQGFVRNEEAQWYQPENAYCRGGLLIIEARKEQKPNPNYRPNSSSWRTNRPQIEYTSACLISRGLHQWQYGRFEMRARIDTSAGLWPAFWTLGVSGQWPNNGEIDIMEYYRGMLLANYAWGSGQPYKARWDDLKKPITDFKADWTQRFHVWRMDWDDKSIKIYVDDQLLNEVDLENTYNPGPEKINAFRQPHYLLLDFAIGGLNGGDPTSTEFPARFEVDYVRVYQKE